MVAWCCSVVQDGGLHGTDIAQYFVRSTNHSISVSMPLSIRFYSGGSLGSTSKLKLIGTGILEVCEWSGSVADRRFRLGRVLGVVIYA